MYKEILYPILAYLPQLLKVSRAGREHHRVQLHVRAIVQVDGEVHQMIILHIGGDVLLIDLQSVWQHKRMSRPP